jgi:hypothetical protein
VVRVVELVGSPGVDEKVMKSALSQLSLMTEDPALAQVFLQHDGLNKVKQIFNTILVPETVLPVVNILYPNKL